MDQLLRTLRRKGLISAGDLIDELGISRATLARLIARAPKEVVRIGKTRATFYGLRESIAGIGDEVPIFRVDETGRLIPSGKMTLLHGGTYVVEPGGITYSGLPPEIADMVPQGFLGRSFAQRHSQDLAIPPRPQDWSNHHILVLEARRGEDLPGNLLIGQESAQRWSIHEPISATHRKNYPHLAKLSLQGQPAGSSAGGEQPKFTTVSKERHVLVKFAESDDSPASQRWRDLLFCEATALEVLRNHGFDSALASAHEIDGMVFLEVERFDRVGLKGRRPVLTLAAIDDFLHGSRDTWSLAAERLHNAKQISAEEARKLRLLDAFCMMIADTDRHFHNVAFFPIRSGHTDLAVDELKLAPAFDKLPMLFAPIAGRVVERQIPPLVPNVQVMDVWEEVREWARDFWNRVSKDQRISREFRDIATEWKVAL